MSPDDAVCGIVTTTTRRRRVVVLSAVPAATDFPTIGGVAVFDEVATAPTTAVLLLDAVVGIATDGVLRVTWSSSVFAGGGEGELDFALFGANFTGTPEDVDVRDGGAVIGRARARGFFGFVMDANGATRGRVSPAHKAIGEGPLGAR